MTNVFFHERKIYNISAQDLNSPFKFPEVQYSRRISFSSLDKKVFCYEHLIYPLSIPVKNIVIRRKNSLMLEYILFSLLSFFSKIFSMYCIKSDSITNTISKKKSFVNTLNIFNPLQVKRSYCYYDDQRANTK